VLKMRNCNTPVDIFNKLWNEEIWRIFDSEKCVVLRRFKSNEKSLTLVKRFFGLILMKSVIGLVAIEDFWDQKLFTVEFEGKEDIISKEHYFDVTSTLEVDYNKLHETLVLNFKRHMQPGFNVCIDEIRIPARHYECEIKKYNLKKPDVWAIESKSIHDSSSYLLDFTNPMDGTQKSPKECVLFFVEYLKTTYRKHHLC